MNSPKMIRIVKMRFRPECVEDFKQLFEERKEMIRAQEGCTHLELLRASGGAMSATIFKFINPMAATFAESKRCCSFYLLKFPVLSVFSYNPILSP
ncbi:MAG: hypothetical protein EOP54_00715 [Sphingobacteriales bacterium]|nr:MAG: hypothetical protein EOP54_00715 [Sphingobacteriales bacterium]